MKGGKTERKQNFQLIPKSRLVERIWNHALTSTSYSGFKKRDEKKMFGKWGIMFSFFVANCTILFRRLYFIFQIVFLLISFGSSLCGEKLSVIAINSKIRYETASYRLLLPGRLYVA